MKTFIEKKVEELTELSGELVDIDIENWLRAALVEAVRQQRKELVEWTDNYEKTRSVQGSDSYQIGQNHGRQEVIADLLVLLQANTKDI